MIVNPVLALLRLLCALAVSFLSSATVDGQSAVFGVPSTETQAKGSGSISADFSAHFDRYSRGGFQTYGPSTIYGFTKNIEAGLNLYSTWNGDSHALELQPHAKWRIVENDDTGFAAAVGMVAFVPLTEAAGPHATAMFYANASKMIKPAKGLRLTGGVYQMAAADDAFGTKTGAMLGVEQPLNNKLTLVADWISGTNKLGYSSAGFRYHLNSSQSLEVGYSIGNSGRANNFLSAFYSFNF